MTLPRPFTACLAVAALAALALPLVVAEPIAQVSTGELWYEWTVGGVSGECRWPPDTVAVTAQQVNSRLVATIESSTRRAHQTPFNVWPQYILPDSNCPLQLSALPGAYVNPCSVLTGQPSAPVVSAVDPYFYQKPGSPWIWEKVVTFSDGGWVRYDLVPESSSGPYFPIRHLWGACASPGASVSFRSYYMWTFVPTEPGPIVRGEYDYACWLTHSLAPLPPCPPAPVG